MSKPRYVCYEAALAILLQCMNCGFIASEVEFSPQGDPRQDLRCPRCGNEDSISDVPG